MAGWETIKEKTVEVGGNNFVEVGVKRPPEGDTLFIALSKGWFTEDKQKRYTANILFDLDKKDEIIEALREVDKDVSK